MDHLRLQLTEMVSIQILELLALQQPMAKDLRRIIGILKIGIDLERIGDLAVDIARVTTQSQNKIQITKLEYIPRMAEISKKMLEQSMEKKASRKKQPRRKKKAAAQAKRPPAKKAAAPKKRKRR